MTAATDALRSSPLGAELTPSEIAVLGALVHLKTLADGEVLLPEGARDPLLHVVVHGGIRILKKGAHGPECIHTLEPGDLVGELSFMDDVPRNTALVAAGPTEVLRLARSDFETLIEREPRIVYKTMRAIMRVAHRVQRILSVQVGDLENYVYRTDAKC